MPWRPFGESWVGSTPDSAESVRVLNSSFFFFFFFLSFFLIGNEAEIEMGETGFSRIGGFDGCGFGVLMCLDLGRRKK